MSYEKTQNIHKIYTGTAIEYVTPNYLVVINLLRDKGHIIYSVTKCTKT